MPKELRSITADVRAHETGGAVVLEGTGIVYDSWSVDLGGFRERIMPGAFDEWLASGPNVVSLFNHRSDYVLGSTRAGTLTLADGEDALRYSVELPQSQIIGDLVAEPVRRGDLAGNSFQFRAIDDTWETVDGEDRRTVTRAELYEVGPVTFPAYQDTAVALRSLEQYRRTANAIDRTANGPTLLDKIVADDELSADEVRELRAIMRKFDARYGMTEIDNHIYRLRLAAI